MADSLNAATKYVATHRPESLEWGPIEGLGADLVEDVRRIKATDGPGLIVWGSSTLTSMLLEHGLAEEVLLLVYPILLGKGKRFFSDGTPPRELTLARAKAASAASSSAPAYPLGLGRPGRTIKWTAAWSNTGVRMGYKTASRRLSASDLPLTKPPQHQAAPGAVADGQLTSHP
jgi:hypothetical protein